MKLIDSDDLLNIVKQWQKENAKATKHSEYAVGYGDCLTAIEDIIADIPTVDAEEEIHAKRKIMADVGVTECPICNWSIEECIDYKFCPNCGAIMDKE